MTVEADFQRECEVAVDQCRLLTPSYAPRVWVRMMQEHGAVEAAKRLLVSPDIQSGFERLIRQGRVDLTIEMAVLNPRWERLFDQAHREAAWWRLTQAAIQ